MNRKIISQGIFWVATISSFAQGAAVSTSSPYATDIALQVLKAGGSAADAACAAGCDRLQKDFGKLKWWCMTKATGSPRA